MNRSKERYHKPSSYILSEFDEAYGTAFPFASGGSTFGLGSNDQLLELARIDLMVFDSTGLFGSDPSSHYLFESLSETARREIMVNLGKIDLPFYD